MKQGATSFTGKEIDRSERAGNGQLPDLLDLGAAELRLLCLGRFRFEPQDRYMLHGNPLSCVGAAPSSRPECPPSCIQGMYEIPTIAPSAVCTLAMVCPQGSVRTVCSNV